jgi:DNA recombination protein RmuC
MEALLLTTPIIISLMLGAALAWLVLRSRNAARLGAALAEARADQRVALATLEERLDQLQKELGRERHEHEATRADAAALREQVERFTAECSRLAERASRIAPLDEQLRQLDRMVKDSQGELTSAKVVVSHLKAQLEAEQAGAAEKIQLLMDAKEELANRFKALAAEILDGQSKKFAEQNLQSLGNVVDPLKTKLDEFRKRVEDCYDTEGKGRTELATQVRQLMDLNHALSQDAKNLTSALKGSVKTQGNWGEMLLERLLEHAGLERDVHYHLQHSQVREDGSRVQPDLVINLPGERRMVVDAKVSLVAYDRYVAAETDAERALALKQHIDSVRAHIKGLSEKNYQTLYKLKSIDFVVMFMPVEPAFTLAAANDHGLFDEAWNRNVLVVTNSTLLFVVRTVAYLWTQDRQNRNAQEIASRGAELYDRFCGFLNELALLGAKLVSAKDHYDEAMKRLSTGKGNVIRQAEMLKELGVKPTKGLPAAFADAAAVDDHHPVALPKPGALAAGQVRAALPPLPPPAEAQL